ncbi:hypothetical protein [Subtercola endophyticus]|uniref:hypothetical protein n=1 Tax=Subtercola endophyticus TaxID=2895559 RepID=UPI001E53521E|nr:hypothetical protein [Subtercola endophyticus]UFS59652.1 hypothetical protein LQ955_02300 [Subtercola endophyticus]
MTSDWLGGGLIVGLAAVLWLIYLLPTWFRRNEFNATERNVVRLQQTLRILAETAEVPEEVRAETNAKSVAEQQRVLRQATIKSIPPAVRAAAKIRRARAVTSAILVVSLAVIVLGSVQVAVNGAWIVLVAGVLASVLCLTRLSRLAKLGRALKLPARDASTIDSFVIVGAGSSLDFAGSTSLVGSGAGVEAEFAEAEADEDGAADALADDSGWTPVPLPKPLYTERRRLRQLNMGQPDASSFGPSSSTSVGFAQQTAEHAESALRAAAATSEAALRASYAAADADAATGAARGAAAADAVTEVAPQSAAPVIPSRFSTMGIVDDLETGPLDVDRVLARRRAG